jgi:hypothetical protein
MPERYECPDCELIFIGGSPECPKCGLNVKGPAKPEGYAPLKPLGQAPCTDEQNRQASRIFADLVTACANRDQAGVQNAKQRMATLFGEST